MPVTAFFQSAATLFYALSSLMGGAHQYAGNMNNNNLGYQIPAARQGFLQNVPELPQHFTPPPLDAINNLMHSPATYNNLALPRNTQPANPTTVPSPSTMHPTTSFQQDPVVSESIQNLKQRARGLVSLLTYRPPQPQRVSGSDHERNAAISKATEHQKSDEEVQAMKTLRKIVDNSLTKENRSGLPPLEEITYYEAETIATLFLEPEGAIARCRLIEVIEPEDARRVLKMIAERQKRIEYISFGTMLTIITACQSLDPQAPPQSPTVMQADDMLNSHRVALSGYSPLFSNSNFNLTSANNPNLNMWSLVSGIVPGTKWCGLGDISASYDDLGPERHLDKCCRAHDHCPIKIKAFRSRYGLVNWSIYTKSHCECDSLFYECLKKAAIPQAEILGNFYFNVLRVQCVDDADQTKCAARDPSSGACKLWQPDDNQPTRMLFRTLRRNF